MHMDKQFAGAVILILVGLGLTQVKQDGDPFLAGIGIGTIAIAAIWVGIRIMKDLKR